MLCLCLSLFLFHGTSWDTHFTVALTIQPFKRTWGRKREFNAHIFSGKRTEWTFWPMNQNNSTFFIQCRKTLLKRVIVLLIGITEHYYSCCMCFSIQWHLCQVWKHIRRRCTDYHLRFILDDSHPRPIFNWSGSVTAEQTTLSNQKQWENI